MSEKSDYIAKMVAKGNTKKQALSYWNRKSKSTSDSSDSSESSPESVQLESESLTKETTKDDLLSAEVNNLNPDAERLPAPTSPLVDAMIENDRKRRKGFRQIGDGTPTLEVREPSFVPNVRGKIPFTNVAADLDHLFLGIGVIGAFIAASLLVLLSGGIESVLWLLPLGGLFVGEWRTINAPRVLPNDVDFVVYSNEDYGFVAALVDGTNNIFAFSMPYPSGMNLFTQTIEAYQIDYIYGAQIAADALIGRGLQVWMSMLDKEFAVDWSGIPTDAEDENIKAHFEGPMYYGNRVVTVPGTTEVTGYEVTVDSNISLRWYPPTPRLRLTTPLFIQMKGVSATVTLATRAIAITGDFALQETIPLRMFYKVVDLEPAEIRVRGAQLRWQILNS